MDDAMDMSILAIDFFEGGLAHQIYYSKFDVLNVKDFEGITRSHEVLSDLPLLYVLKDNGSQEGGADG